MIIVSYTNCEEIFLFLHNYRGLQMTNTKNAEMLKLLRKMDEEWISNYWNWDNNEISTVVFKENKVRLDAEIKKLERKLIRAGVSKSAVLCGWGNV
jgi:hypothetical protein